MNSPVIPAAPFWQQCLQQNGCNWCNGFNLQTRGADVLPFWGHAWRSVIKKGCPEIVAQIIREHSLEIVRDGHYSNRSVYIPQSGPIYPVQQSGCQCCSTCSTRDRSRQFFIGTGEEKVHISLECLHSRDLLPT